MREDIINALEINNEGLDFVLNNPVLDKYKTTFENDREILERTLTIIEDGLKEERKYIEETTFGRIPTLTKLTEEEKIIQKQERI